MITIMTMDLPQYFQVPFYKELEEVGQGGAVEVSATTELQSSYPLWFIEQTQSIKLYITICLN